MKLSFGDLVLDELGRVILSDADLGEIEDLGLVSVGGTDGQINSGTCVNSASCAATTNGQCTNTQGACERSNNTKCPTKDEMETIEP